MEAFEPDFEIIKMDAEIASYQEDFDPDDRGSDGRRTSTIEGDPSDADR